MQRLKGTQLEKTFQILAKLILENCRPNISNFSSGHLDDWSKGIQSEKFYHVRVNQNPSAPRNPHIHAPNILKGGYSIEFLNTEGNIYNYSANLLFEYSVEFYSIS